MKRNLKQYSNGVITSVYSQKWSLQLLNSVTIKSRQYQEIQLVMWMHFKVSW